MPGIRWVIATCIILFVNCEPSSEPGLVDSTPTWVVAIEPHTRIGGEESDQVPLYQVAGATRISSGYLIVNRSANELRLYDFGGHLKEVMGREGSGPGEFLYPQLVGSLRDDSVAVYDSRNNRVSIICSGTHVCTESPIRNLGRVVGAGHEYLVLRNVSGVQATSPGEQRGSYDLSVLNRATGDVDTLAVIEGQPYQFGGQDNTIFQIPIFLTRPPQVSAAQDLVFLANGRDPQLEIWTLSGRHVRTVPLPIDLRPVSDSEFESVAKEMVSVDDRPGWRRTIEAMTPPPYRAPIRRLLADRTDLVWVELDQGQPENHEWLVADTAGNLHARVNTPIDVNLLEIGEDYVIGVWQDTLGVEYVQVHQLERR